MNRFLLGVRALGVNRLRLSLSVGWLSGDTRSVYISCFCGIRTPQDVFVKGNGDGVQCDPMRRAFAMALLLAVLAPAPGRTTPFASRRAQAAAPKAKKPQPDSIRGEVVELSCYLVDKERIGEAHAAHAQEGIANGNPVGILTNDGQLYLALGRDFKTANDLLAGYAGRKVRVTGKKVRRAKMAGFVVEHVEELPATKSKKK